mmetsp:Transcript_13207/g.52936  ORF Transcript_13207/g.52936 Transcript_13207/m.52936 type:complete len:325 (+) Transcript_13207:71-1045(+)
MAEEPRPSKVGVWVLATRPNTLALSFTPVMVGASIVSRSSDLGGSHVLTAAVLFWLFAALIQIGTNLHNDYSDFVKGADTAERVGQARATQKGWLTARETLGGSLTALAGAASIGFGLTFLNAGSDASVMAFVTLTSLFNAVAYTGGYPLTLVGLGRVSLGYAGLGDVFVLLYFGYVATLAPYYLASPPSRRPPEGLVLAATPLGFLATAVMVVNNLRDRKTDVKAGKRTLAARFGAAFARTEYFGLVIGAYAILAGAVAVGAAPPTWLLAVLSAPLARSQLHAIATKDGGALNPHVGGTAKLQLVFGALLFVGVVAAPSSSTP